MPAAWKQIHRPGIPNCLCDLTIKEAEGGGWKAVYEISAQACEMCQGYAGQ